jgi:hypothetical protein
MPDETTPTPDPTVPLLPPATPERGLRAKVPKPVATVVDRALDVADEVADELKRAIDRIR